MPAPFPRSDFPALVRAPGLAYLDNAATLQKPSAVIREVTRFLSEDTANVGRGFCPMSDRAEAVVAKARQMAAAATGAADPREIAFCHNATHAANLLARGLWLGGAIRPGDRALVWMGEHHSSSAPYSLLAQEGLNVEFFGRGADFWKDLADLKERVAQGGAAVVVVSAASNVSGVCPDIAAVRAAIGQKTVLVCDASQAVAHFEFSAPAAGADACFWSGHKAMADTGTGVLWVRKGLCDRLGQGQPGGGAVLEVRENGVTPADGMVRFEAGTPHLSGIASLAAALEYLAANGGPAAVRAAVHPLMRQLWDGLVSLGSRIHVVGPNSPHDRAALVSFKIDGANPADAAEFLARRGVCVRPGAHCAGPLARALGLGTGTLRASLFAYNSPADVDRFLSALGEFLSETA